MKAYWNVGDGCTGCVDHFGKLAIFTTLILPNYEYERTFQLLVSSSIS